MVDLLQSYSYSIFLFKDNSFFIPAPLDNPFATTAFESSGGKYDINFPFGPGWLFENKEGEDLELVQDYFHSQTISYVFVRNMDIELHSY